jgi:sugar phosphate isomerase/epimerase
MTQIPPLLCSTGAFNRYPDYTFYRDILEYGPLLDVDGFEVMFYSTWYPEISHIATHLQSSGLSFPAVHAEKSIGVGLGQPNRSAREQALHNFQLNCQLAQQIGASIIILHLWGWPELDDHLAYNLDLLPQCLDAAANYNLEIAIETIPCRVSTPLDNVHLAVSHDSRSHVTLDTEFLALHNQMTEVFNTPWLWLDHRIRHIHIKDFSGNGLSLNGRRHYLHPGEGVIDFPSFFSHLHQQHYQGNISLESPVLNDEGHINLPKLKNSLSSLHSLLTQAYSD